MQLSSSSQSSGHRLASTNVCSDRSPDTLILPHFLAQPKMVWLVTWPCPVVKGITMSSLLCPSTPPRCSSRSPWSSSAVPFPLYSPYPNQRQTIDALLLILPSKYILNRLVIRQTPFHQPNDIKYKNELSRILALVLDDSIITSET